LIAGLVVGGYGGAALYISPLANYLITNYGISGSFIGLGIFFAIVVIIAGQLLAWPPAGYVPPPPPVRTVASKRPAATPAADWKPGEILGTWQAYALILMFIGSAQSGLLVIANAAPILGKTAGKLEFFVANAWILASFGGLINASGRIGTGLYSDKIGRGNAYTVNGIVSAVCLLATPFVMKIQSIPLLFLVLGIAYWQYGGGLALMPAFTADFFGTKNLGMNYGIVFLGWGFGFLIPLLAGYIKDVTGSYDLSFYISAVILVTAVILNRVTRRPSKV
jgi:OFA family oxalate/formate antiporter-like MFS transporter